MDIRSIQGYSLTAMQSSRSRLYPAANWVSTMSLWAGKGPSLQPNNVDPLLAAFCTWVNDTLTNPTRTMMVEEYFFAPYGTGNLPRWRKKVIRMFMMIAISRWIPRALRSYRGKYVKESQIHALKEMPWTLSFDDILRTLLRFVVSVVHPHCFLNRDAHNFVWKTGNYWQPESKRGMEIELLPSARKNKLARKLFGPEGIDQVFRTMIDEAGSCYGVGAAQHYLRVVECVVPLLRSIVNLVPNKPERAAFICDTMLPHVAHICSKVKGPYEEHIVPSTPVIGWDAWHIAIYARSQ